MNVGLLIEEEPENQNQVVRTTGIGKEKQFIHFNIECIELGNIIEKHNGKNN
jgi:hypothetical protein